MKLVPAPAGSEWMWSLLLTHPGRPAFRLPTNGRCVTRGQAASRLGACYGAFRAWFAIDGSSITTRQNGTEGGPVEVR